MSAYPPPNETLPIFNPVDFQVNNIALTINDAKDYFLEYPTAQGKETLSAIDVNGASVFNDTATHNDLVIVNQPSSSLNGVEIITDNPGNSITATARTSPGTAGKMTITGSSSLAKENPIVVATDSVISTSINGADDTGALTITQKSSTTGSGIKMTNNKVICYGNLELENATNNTGGITFPDGTTQTTSFTPSTPNLSAVLTSGNSAGSTDINLNSNNLTSTNSIVFGDGTTQTTAYVGQSINTQTATSNSVGYDAASNITSYTFLSGAIPLTYDAFEWIFNTPLASRTAVAKTLLGSAPPFNPGNISPNSSFVYATGIGMRQTYTASSSNMITYCNGYQEDYTASTQGAALNLTQSAIIGGTWYGSYFSTDAFGEDIGTCPPTGTPNPNSGTLVIQLTGNFSGLGNATLKFIETI